MSRIGDAERRVLEFVVLEQTSLTQALRTMVEINEKNAAELEGDHAAVAKMLRESAQSWQAKAAKLDELLIEALPEEVW